jgi:hypothetical protein
LKLLLKSACVRTPLFFLMLLVSRLAHVNQKRPVTDEFDLCIEGNPEVSFDIGPSKRLDCRAGDIEVKLNIYDITHDSSIQNINKFFAPSQSPLKLGGLFHVGVEIKGLEWAYGWTSSGSGVTCSIPRCEFQHHFRESISLAKTKLSESDIQDVLRCLFVEYRGCDYHMIQRNCCNFAEDLCQRLGVGSMPAWIQRMAKVADNVLKTTLSLTMLPPISSDSNTPGPQESKSRSRRCRSSDTSKRCSSQNRRQRTASPRSSNGAGTPKRILCF